MKIIFNQQFLTTLFVSLFIMMIQVTSFGQCIDINIDNAYVNDDDFGQSFITPALGCGNTISSIVMKRSALASGPTNTHGGAAIATISIYTGQSVDLANRIYTQSGIAIPDVVGDNTYNLGGGTGSLVLAPSTQYTIYVELDKIVRFRLCSNTYASGTAYLLGGFLSGFDLYLEINMTGSPLPVELSSFEAIEQNSSVSLLWETASELNNKGFEVQRSADGENWENIGFVEGNGTIQEAQNYSFTDYTPLSGDNYYRLKQIDFDEQYEYSNIINLTIQESNNRTIQIFPNPVKEQLTIQGVTGRLSIYNVLGQPVYTTILDENNTQIPMTAFPSGQYFVEVLSDDGQKITKRMVKQ